MGAFVTFFLALSLVTVSHCYIQPIDMPSELSTCLQAYHARHNDTADELEVHADCLDQFVWKTGRIRWSDYNVTQADLEFLKSLSRSFVHEHARVRRTVKSPFGPMGLYPTTGFKVRREIRRLTDRERSEFFKTMNILKKMGTYDLFAAVHQGVVIQSAHFGGNFMSWHRVYCALFEEALRRVNRRVALPYWDTSLDYAMHEPVFSVIWSALFFGNGDGYLRTGAFAGWRTIRGDPVTRNINGEGILLSKQAAARILTRCRSSEITYPTAKPQFNFDLIHGGVHRWVGGHMSGFATATADPSFFLYHCYIDYLWEQFRIKQARVCGINPTTDYPVATGLQNPKRRMDAFSFYRNADGYSGFWTQAWYRYEHSPSCGPGRPSCGSPYLRCVPHTGECVSVIAPRHKGFGPGYRAGMSPKAFLQTVLRSESEVRTVRVDAPFPTPSVDPRTAAVRYRRPSVVGRRRRDVSVNIRSTYPEVTIDTSVPESNIVFNDRSPTEILPSATEVWNQRSGSTLQPPVENTFVIDGKLDQSAWVYMPVKIVSLRSEFAEQYLNLTVQSQPDSAQCQPDVSGASQIRLQSQGLNYAGVYEDLALVDTNVPASTSISYVGVKDPRDEASDVMIMASDGCNRLCEAKCLTASGDQPTYKSCDGTIRLTDQPPLMYGKTVDEIAASVWTWSGNNLDGPVNNIPLVFVCA